jgi:hypothetical protein
MDDMDSSFRSANLTRHAGLVPGIHVPGYPQQERRGWPGRSPAMTKERNPVVLSGRLILIEPYVPLVPIAQILQLPGNYHGNDIVKPVFFE